MSEITYIFLKLPLFILIIFILYFILRNPFKYPYFIHNFDITSKRNVKFENFIDKFLLNKDNWNSIQQHELSILRWKGKTEKYLQSCVLKKYRTRQYEKILDDNHAYRFKFIRKQTRYRQKNYVKTSYKVNMVKSEWTVNWYWIEDRYQKLKAIGFETTLNKYNSKNQRKLMTSSLRKQIMERDEYTCKNCGKYMPDEVGLHIDHIVPIARGGKTIPSNLRVLCSKCNGRKGTK